MAIYVYLEKDIRIYSVYTVYIRYSCICRVPPRAVAAPLHCRAATTSTVRALEAKIAAMERGEESLEARLARLESAVGEMVVAKDL